MRHLGILVAICTLLGPAAALAGCGDDDGQADGGVDAAGLDAGTDGGLPGCTARITVGPAGGALEGCGARLELPAGAVTEDTELVVERAAVSGEPPWDYAFVAEAYTFSTAGTPPTGYLVAILPYTGPASRTYPAVLDPVGGTWAIVEPCSGAGSVMSFVTYGLGTFTVVHDTVAFPESVSGLGGGTIDVDLDGTAYSFDLDPSGHGVYELGQDGSRGVSIEATDPVSFHNLRLTLGIEADGSAVFAQEVSLALYDGEYTIWGYLLPVDGETGTITLDAPAGDVLQGTYVETLHLGTDRATTSPFTAVLDLTLERWRWPLEATCAE